MTNFVTALKNSIRHSLLLAVVADRGLLVHTGTTPPYPTYGDTLPEPGRTLAREYDGESIAVVKSTEQLKEICEILASESSTPGRPGKSERAVVLFQIPGTTLPESILSRMAYSLSLPLPPKTVHRHLDAAIACEEFSPENIAELRAKHHKVMMGVGDAFINRVVKAVRATRPDTVEFMDRVSVGILNTFGYGLSPRAEINLVRICAAEAVINGRDYVREEDLVKCFPGVAAHAICWGSAKPYYPTYSALTQIAEWAISI